MGLKKVQTRTHRERSQPAARQKFGLLEKHKDYVLRARDYHKKEKRIKALKQKAAMKNPDEFYFGMVKARTAKGIHSVAGKSELPQDVLKLMKTQDLHYVSMMKHVNERKLERLRAELPQGLLPAGAPEHMVFAADEPERQQILEEGGAAAGPVAAEAAPARVSSTLREYRARQERVAALAVAEHKLQAQKHMLQPGRRKVVGTDAYNQPIFKWRAERKK